MAIGDRLMIRYSEKHQDFYLVRGRETFYYRDVPDDDPRKDRMRTWDTADEARGWAIANLGEDPMNNYDPEEAQERRKTQGDDWSDLPLFGKE